MSVNVQHLSSLARVGWLAGQPPALQARIAASGRWRTFEKGQFLYQAGDDPDGMFGLAAGIFEVQIPMGQAEQITIHRAEPGTWIGESAILARTTRSISILAAVTSRVFFVPAPAITTLLNDSPGFWPCFFELSHINASRAAAALAELLSRTPRERLARILLRLSDDAGRISATQEDLSRLIGMTRSSLRRIVADLIEAGALETGYRQLRIVDRARLQAVIHGG